MSFSGDFIIENAEKEQTLIEKADSSTFTESNSNEPILGDDVIKLNIDCQEQHIKQESHKEKSSDSPVIKKNDHILVTKVDDFSLNRSEVSSENASDKDDELELRYEDDMDVDDDDITNEDALLEDNMEVEDNIIHEQRATSMVEVQGNKEQENSNKDKDIRVVEKVEPNKDNDQIDQDDSSKFDSNKGVTIKKNSLNENLDGSVDKFDIKIKSVSASLIDTIFQPIKEHGLNKPDIMLEIPTQESIEFSDDDDCDDENEYEKMSLKMSPDIEDILLSENIDSIEDVTDLDDKINYNIKDNAEETNIEMLLPVKSDESTGVEKSDESTGVEKSDESYRTMSVVSLKNITNSKNDNTNALSDEAEIAAKIITKEMNAMGNETTFIEETEGSEEGLLLEDELYTELNKDKKNCEGSLRYIPTEKIKEKNIHVIEILDDNTNSKKKDTKINFNISHLQKQNLQMSLDCHELGSSIVERDLSNQDSTEKKLILDILEDDILNDAREIDRLLLSKEISKPNKVELKDIDGTNKFMVKTCKAEMSVDDTEPNNIFNKTSNGKESTHNINTLSGTNEKQETKRPAITQDEPNQNNNGTSLNISQISQHNTTANTNVLPKPHNILSESDVADLLLPVQLENDVFQHSISQSDSRVVIKKEPHPSTSNQTSDLDNVKIKDSQEITDFEVPAVNFNSEIAEKSTKITSKNEDVSMEIDNLEQLSSKHDTGTAKKVDPKSTSTILEKTVEMDESKPSTSKSELVLPRAIEPKPSSSQSIIDISESNLNSVKNVTFDLSTLQELSSDVPEMTDSLGLLAESSRVMEDDEEHDDDDYGEDEDDFDDESSNQMTAEHSEDSNTHQSESDLKDSEISKAEKEGFNFTIITDINNIAVPPEKIEYDEVKCTEKLEESKGTPVNEVPDKEIPIINKIKAMDNDTVELSDTSGTEDDNNKIKESVLKTLLLEDTQKQPTESVKASWNKTKNLSISKQQNILSFVDLEESSSDEEKKDSEANKSLVEPPREPDATINISEDVTSLEETTEISNDTETVNSESPIPRPVKEVQEDQVSVLSDKVLSEDQDLTSIPPETQPKSPSELVFNLDSDDDEESTEKPSVEEKVVEETLNNQPKLHGKLKCINRSCTSKGTCGYYVADTSTAIYFEADKKKRAYVCEKCAENFEKRNQELVEGVKNFKPLYELHTGKSSEELVEISDSESDEEPEPVPAQFELVGEKGAKLLEEKLANKLNEMWAKLNMDSRIADYKLELQKELNKLQKESEEINSKFDECQVETDKLRNSLYATFDTDIQELPPVLIYDMPGCNYSCMELPTAERRQPKRRLSQSKESMETPAKKMTPAAPPKKIDQEVKSPNVDKFDDDNTDISVVKLSVESAPADLPPPGELSHPPIKVGMTVYAMKNAYGTWLRAKVVEIQPKTHATPFTMCRVRFEHKVNKNPMKTLAARYLSYFEPPEVRMTIGTRVIALFKDISSRNAYYSGIVAEIPNPVNNYRYLIFFDDGYAQYAPHSQTRLVCECSSLVWEEVHPYSREFVRGYLLAYPERPMVRLHSGQNLKTEWRGKWWSSRVVNVDASLVEVQFLRCDRREWIYRGSTRLAPLYLELQAAERHRPRALPRTQPQSRTNMPYVEYTRSAEQTDKQAEQQEQRQQQNEEIRRQRAVAKKSTVSTQPPPQPAAANLDNVTSRVVYYTPKNAVKPYKMTPHVCSGKCKRSDVLALKDLRTYNPLAKPLLSGWERQIVRWKGNKEVMYVSPCGRRLRHMKELHRYLRATDSDMPVDLFDFSPDTHCLAEFVLNKCFVGKKDLSHGKENVQVPCVNYYDESLPEFCSYNTERTPTTGVPLNLDPEFLCGCDCEDDCVDKSKCACWKMTLEGARTIGYEGDVGYVYRRLPEPLPSGIYECNSRCKCKNTCLNRVAQHPLQLKLQVFKTLNRGWGIRALNDVPKGAFLCVYAGNLLTDATANLDGLNEGDEYLAELDYIEVVEQMKEGYEEDIPDKIKALDKKELAKKLFEGDDEDESSEEDDCSAKNEDEDDDFQPGFIGLGVAEFNKRLRRRESKKDNEEAKQADKEKEKENEKEKEKESNPDEECITISDDEEVREPSCFTAAAGMGNEFISKYRSVRTLFGEDEACYIMDAKVQGNIGRYLNHSCAPNVFVQNVFVDTHDPRFPWVAFFALHAVRAGTELTWNYNYDVGSVPGKVLYCFCGAPNCRGRLL